MLDPVPDNQRLPHFPVSVFSTVMGMTGFAIAWQKACSAWGMPEIIALALVGGKSAGWISKLEADAATWRQAVASR